MEPPYCTVALPQYYLKVKILPDKRQRDDIIRVNRDEPITVLAVWVGVGKVWRQNESRRSCNVSTARS